MPSGRKRFTQRQVERDATPAAPAELEQAKVTVVSGATPPVVTVRWRGANYQFPHLLQYTPVVNDVVALAPYAGSWLILGRPGGFPS